MPSHRPPLSGYNHNIRYRDQVYHVQTEDSGVERPHVITHLFLDGLILATLRSEYRHMIHEVDHAPRVRLMMQEQHKAIMKQLRRGELDGQIQMLASRPALPDPPDLNTRERASLGRGQRLSQQVAELTRISGVVPVVLHEFGAIRMVDLQAGDDEESLELDLDAIARLDLEEPPRAPSISGGGVGEELDLDDWENPEATPRPLDLEMLMQVRVTRSDPDPPRQRIRTPSLPPLPGEGDGLSWEPATPPRMRRKP